MPTKNAIDSANPVEVAAGGTGAATLTDHGALVGAGTGAITALTAASDGQLIIGSTGNTPVLATLIAGSNMTITEGAGTITLASSAGGGLAWTEVTGTSAGMSVNSGYIANNVALVTLTLPVTAAVGDIVAVVGKGAGGWKIAQNAGQQIYMLYDYTTPGTGGYILSELTAYDCVELVCITADTDFVVRSSMGNITIV